MVNSHTGSCMTSSSVAWQAHGATFNTHEVVVPDMKIDWRTMKETNLPQEFQWYCSS
jgi:hypothetical protein